MPVMHVSNLILIDLMRIPISIIPEIASNNLRFNLQLAMNSVKVPASLNFGLSEPTQAVVCFSIAVFSYKESRRLWAKVDENE